MKPLTQFIIIAMLFVACTETNKDKNVTGDEDTMVLQNKDNLDAGKVDYTNWNVVDLGAPIVEYDEVKSRDIVVRQTVVGSDSASVYSIDQEIMFDFDKASLRQAGKEKLDEIAASIKKRYPSGALGIYGYTDAIGSKEYNKELSEQRAERVKQYLNQQTNIDMSRINTYARGEQNPVATNATPAGRQENRRVDIVARNER